MIFAFRREQTSSVIYIFYSYFRFFFSLIIKGYKKPLQDKDLYELNEIDKAGAWVPAFEKHWANETATLIRSASRRPCLIAAVRQHCENVEP